MLKRWKGKESKGITLIALVITIIVLLILAGASIAMLTGENGILNQAYNAKEATEEAEKEEQQKLLYAEYQIAKSTGEATGSYEDYVLQEKYGLKIGDYVDYVEGSKTSEVTATENGASAQTFSTLDLGWRVLGIDESGQVQLISNVVKTSTVSLLGEEGYCNADTILNRICSELYTTEKGVARSITVEDVNKAANNYDPTTYSGYNTIWKFRVGTGTTYYTGRSVVQGSNDGGSTWKDTICESYKVPGGETISVSNAKEITEANTYYTYSTTKITDSTIKSVIAGDGTSSTAKTWLASKYFYCIISYNKPSPSYGARTLSTSTVSTTTLYQPLSQVESGNTTYYYRPIVTLNADIELDTTDTTKDGSSLANAWVLK